MQITATPEEFGLVRTFTISRGSRSAARVLTLHINHAGVTGRAESVPYARYGETMESVIAQIMSMEPILHSLDPSDPVASDLRPYLAAGAARNALDCALWDWRAKASGRRVWEKMALPAPGPVITAFTLSLDTPEAMEAQARAAATRPVLKIKLGTPDDMARLEAVRRGAPRAVIIVDANEGWDAAIYTGLSPHLLRLGVALVEQPLPAGADDMLAEIARPIPVCADESCHDRASLAALQGKYDMVNIKLDKTGGLTEALAMRDQARREGYGFMVGCMLGTSLAMAPAMLLAQGADHVDLDGPLLLSEDRAVPLRYDAAGVHPPEAGLWG